MLPTGNSSLSSQNTTRGEALGPKRDKQPGDNKMCTVDQTRALVVCIDVLPGCGILWLMFAPGRLAALPNVDPSSPTYVREMTHIDHVTLPLTRVLNETSGWQRMTVR